MPLKKLTAKKRIKAWLKTQLWNRKKLVFSLVN